MLGENIGRTFVDLLHYIMSSGLLLNGLRGLIKMLTYHHFTWISRQHNILYSPIAGIYCQFQLYCGSHSFLDVLKKTSETFFFSFQRHKFTHNQWSSKIILKWRSLVVKFDLIGYRLIPDLNHIENLVTVFSDLLLLIFSWVVCNLVKERNSVIHM